MLSVLSVLSVLSLLSLLLMTCSNCAQQLLSEMTRHCHCSPATAHVTHVTPYSQASQLQLQMVMRLMQGPCDPVSDSQLVLELSWTGAWKADVPKVPGYLSHHYAPWRLRG